MITRDAKRTTFKYSSKAERDFYRSLKKVAQASGHLVEQYTRGATITDVKALERALNSYAKQLEPWAVNQARKLLNEVSKSNQRKYAQKSKVMGELMQSNVFNAPEGQIAMALINEQVGLIKSIPIEAGLRAQRIAAENFLAGARAVPDPSVVRQLEEEMGMSTQVAVNRARLIARTETARSNAAFVQTRAESIGVVGYIWRTTMDGAERESHARMNGKYVRYDKAPTLIDGTVGHAGTFPNCRCWQDPVLPELD